MVVTHSHITLSPTDRGQAVADFFRLNRQGKIVEHWDVIHAGPRDLGERQHDVLITRCSCSVSARMCDMREWISSWASG